MNSSLKQSNLQTHGKDFNNTALIIPSRLDSVRLPQKPLTMIGSLTIIEHVLNGLKNLNLNHIYVATDSLEIATKAHNAGYKYIMTDKSCSTGTDRVYQAYKMLNNDNIEFIINLQGDMPFIDSKIISDLIIELQNSSYDIITPVIKVGVDIANSESNVKVVHDSDRKALYFSRTLIPYNASEYLYHLGIYGFKRSALEKFVALPKSSLEIAESLEQLRALENGMSIGVTYVEGIPISVDTKEDLQKAIQFYDQTLKINGNF